jgi:hypothetical protein
VQAYPGVPDSTTFATINYWWRKSDWITLVAMQREVEAIVQSTVKTPGTPADAATRAYASALAGWLPRLIALRAYYDDRRFVDDEFAFGRNEARELARTAAALAKLRVPMRSAVFAAWRDRVAAHPDDTRAAVGRGWASCMLIADRVMEKAGRPTITKAVSDCRASIPPLVGLARAENFDHEVRATAIALGDWVVQGYPSWNTQVADALGKLTRRFVELWAKLPAPVERAP